MARDAGEPLDADAAPRRFVATDLPAPVALTVAGGRGVAFTRSKPGRVGPNEDAAAVVGLGAGRAVLAVADGVGGHASGDQASAAAVEALVEAVLEAATGGAGDDGDEGALRNGILDGFERANRRILDLGTGAATTLTVAEIEGARVRPYHVGDSVLLLVGQRGRLKHQTTPHSPTGLAVEAGFLDEGEAMHHAERHVITNAVGSTEMHIAIGPSLAVSARDTLLLGSDGLFDNLTLDEIVADIRCGPLARRAARLVEAAGARMGAAGAGQPSKPDDLTFVAWRPGGA